MTSLVIEQRVLLLNSECCHQVANLHNDNKQMRGKKLNKKMTRLTLLPFPQPFMNAFCHTMTELSTTICRFACAQNFKCQ